MVAVMSEKWP